MRELDGKRRLPKRITFAYELKADAKGDLYLRLPELITYTLELEEEDVVEVTLEVLRKNIPGKLGPDDPGKQAVLQTAA